jgi:prolyl-tRNA editing enzyme YbaK/EbsC (Cys-tRNA(Pro) deacylase)
MGYFEQSPEELGEFLDFMERDLENVRRVIETVEEAGIDADFMVHEKAETVDESAENTDVEARDIVKTLVFVAEEPLAVLCSGDRRVDEDKLEDVVGEPVRMASP